MKLHIPGNLLISGEYAVTLEGGKGIGVAVQAYATLESQKADTFSIHSTYQGKDYSWKEGETVHPNLSLAEIVCGTVREHLKKKALTFPLSISISIDTSQFYYPEGRKKGFGSSAAVCAGLTFLLLGEAYGEYPDVAREVFPLSLAAHRKFQGGKGSGYDIAASLFGGTGLFTGGRLPTWSPIRLEWLDACVLVRGDEAASTKGALDRFNSFKEKHPDLADHFFKMSNDVADQLAGCQDIESAKAAFSQAQELNHWISEKLGILPEGKHLKEILDRFRKRSCPAKALGAGGEIAAAIVEKEEGKALSFLGQAEPLIISSGGLRCAP